MKKYAWVKRTDWSGRVSYHSVVNPKWVYQNYTGPRLRREYEAACERNEQELLKRMNWLQRIDYTGAKLILKYGPAWKAATTGGPVRSKGTVWNPGPMSTPQFMAFVFLILVILVAVFAH